MIGFIPQIARLIEFIVPEKQSDIDKKKYKLVYKSAMIQDIPELNILNAKNEIVHMTEVVEEMFNLFINVFKNPDKKMGDEVEKLREMEDFTDQMREQITSFIIECNKENLDTDSRNNTTSMIRIISELESLGDSCFSLIMLTEKRYKKNTPFHAEAIEEILPYAALVSEFLTFIKENLNHHLSQENYVKANVLEDQIDKNRDVLRKKARNHITEGADVKGELLYIDIVRNIENMGDYCLNIAQNLRKIK
jgi:phosphate:Na+ symporter